MTRPTATEQQFIPLGEWVEGYGEVEMVGFTGGERYYWMVNQGVVSMIPAFMAEPDYFAETR